MPASAPPDRIIAGFQRIYEEAEYEALRVLADAVGRKAKKADRDDLAAQAAELTRLRTQLDGIATSLNRRVGRALPETLTEANLWGGRQAIADLDAAFGPAARRYDSPINKAALDHLARSMADQLTPVHLAVTRNVEDAYKAIIGASTTGVLTGTQTRVEATQRAMDRFAASGIRGFTDKAGRNWQLSTYTEMAIRTAAARAAVDAHVEKLVQSGVELGYCSDSPQECGLCRPFEHKIVTLTGSNGPGTVTTINELTEQPAEVEVVGSLTYIRALGFLHPNCTHSVAIYLHGLTKLRTNTENPQGYDDRQKLRALERNVRAAKRVQAAALTPDAAKTAGARVRAGQTAIRDHVKATGLIRQPHREQLVDGDAAAAITPQATLNRAKRDQARERARLRRQIAKGQDTAERDRQQRELVEQQAAALSAEKARIETAARARTTPEQWAGDVDRIAALEVTDTRDERLAEIWRLQGYDQPPTVVTAAEFDALPPGHQVLYRGIAGEQAAAWAEDFRSGEVFPGLGTYGNGTYAATELAEAEGFARGTGWRGATVAGVVVRMALRPDARTISLNDLRVKYGSREELFEGAYGRAFGDPGRLAAAMGYDAIWMQPDPTEDERYYVVLNRAQLVVEEA